MAEEVKQETQANEMDFTALISQVENERLFSEKYLQPKKTEWLKRLKVYDNQKRDPDAVGDPLLFTTFQTILASLYDDRLTVEFTGREEGDDEVAENLNDVAEFDYDKMEKDQIDYDWDWDTCFFGRGILAFTNYDRKKNLPIPEVVDPISFLRDPFASSINGNAQGNGACRYFGRYVRKTKRELKEEAGYFNIDKIKLGEMNFNSIIEEGRQLRDEAQNRETGNKAHKYDFGENSEYEILEWYTYHEGKKVFVCFGVGTDEKNKTTLVPIKYRPVRGDVWEYVDRVLYPSAHDWDGVSIPDIIEDKQRLRAVILNLAQKGLKADLYPNYVYDKNKIKNKADLQNIEFNKYIPSDGDPNGAVAPMTKASPNYALVNYILETIDASAQRATATPELQQGVTSKEQRTLGELNLVAAKVDTRYSLSAKVFGWSEKRFWERWYYLYKKNFKSFDEKTVRIVGAFGAKYRTLTRENLVGQDDPDIKIDSRILAEARRMKDRANMIAYLNLIMADPNANRRYALKRVGKLFGLKRDELERLLPPTQDEMQAEDENEMLNKNKDAVVKASDNHVVHLEMHNKAADTPAKLAHIATHKEALRLKKEQPELFPQEQGLVTSPIQGQQMAAPQTPSQNAAKQLGFQ